MRLRLLLLLRTRFGSREKPLHSSSSRVKANNSVQETPAKTMKTRRQLERKPGKSASSPLMSHCVVVASICLAASGAIFLANCQASDGDEQFQAYHQDIGRISGSASRAAVAPATQTVLRQAPQQQQQRQQELPIESNPEQRAAPQATRPRGQSSGQQAAPARKPNRITLAVRQHAPVPQPPAGPVSGPAAEPPAQASLVGQQSPFTPLAAPSFQPTFQSMAPAEPIPVQQHPSNQRSSSLASSVSARHSALMAHVAAERSQLVSAAAADQPAPHFQSEQFASSQSPSSAVAAQVQPPPLLFQQQPQPQPQQQAAAAASPALAFVDQPEEPLVAPSFEQVLSQGCPQKGVLSWENKDYCDRYYMCTNGTFTEEACPNGLGYSQMGAVYQHCAYNWNVDCGSKKTAQPLASAGCPWQFGIFPVAAAAGRCSIDYYVCEWGVPETKRCSPEGLFYDDRIKGCQWADQLGCKSEALLNFKCPPEDEDNPYWPYPRYYHTKQDVIVCVNEQPRLVHCTDEQAVDPGSLACIDLRPKKQQQQLKKRL